MLVKMSKCLIIMTMPMFIVCMCIFQICHVCHFQDLGDLEDNLHTQERERARENKVQKKQTI